MRWPSHPESNPSGRRKGNMLHPCKAASPASPCRFCLSRVGSTAPSCCWAKKSCHQSHQNNMFLSSSVLLSREWFLCSTIFVELCSLIIIQNIQRHWSWRQYLPKHILLGRRSDGKCHQEAKEGVSCAKQDRLPQQTTWRDCFASCLKGCMYRTPWMGLSWRPSSAGRLFGNVELLGYLTCIYMSDSCSLSPPSSLRIKMLGSPCNQRVVSYQKSQKISKIVNLYPCHVTWSVSRTFRAASRESWSRSNSVIRAMLKTRLQISRAQVKPDQIDVKCLVHLLKEETISSVPCHSLMPLDNNHSNS